jgi:hypothetical protein
MQQPAKYLVVIDAAGEMVARMFDAQRRLLAEFDASSSEVAVMTQGLRPARDAAESAWDDALRGHNRQEREQAEVFTLDV